MTPLSQLANLLIYKLQKMAFLHGKIEHSLRVEMVYCGKQVGDLHGGRERHRDLRMRTPGREHAEIPLAVPHEGRREERYGGVIPIVLVCASLMYVILLALRCILLIRTRTVLRIAKVLVELKRDAHRLLHLVNPRRLCVVLGRHRLE